MSLITRCPACQTMFKVVPDQLRISEGWVRCGKCEEIFDASADLQEVMPQDSRSDSPDTVPFDGALATAMASEDAAPGAAGHFVRQEPSFETQGTVDFELREPQDDMPSVLEPVTASGALLPDGSAYGVAAAAQAQPAPEVPTRAPEAPIQKAEPSFMRHARKASRWHRPLVRAALLVVCLLLLTGLAVQILVQERDRIAAVEPELRPILEELCLQLDCRVGPLRQIESVVIDSSAFSKVKGDMYRLSLTLKNNAPIDLAMPAVELALTDTLDQPLVRRVFRPEELGVKSGVIPAASEIQSTLVLTVKTNGNGERVAGYRLLAFYP